jgi:hypothetical protein
MLGIAPTPQSDYGIQTGDGLPALKATPGDVAASRRLWGAVMQLNRRIAKLVPALLQPRCGRSLYLCHRHGTIIGGAAAPCAAC